MAALSSPHLHGPDDVTRVMLRVVYALIPALLLQSWLFGWGVPINVALALVGAWLGEAGVLSLRGYPLRPYLMDGSVTVTALLLAMALPPMSPWWLTLSGSLFAVVIAKHLYGGLGYNPFNPAMAGYVFLLISFPLEMSSWLAPGGFREHGLGLAESLRYVFTGALPGGLTLDAITSATALDYMKTELGLARTVGEVRTAPVFGALGGAGSEWVNGLILLGGLWLIYRRVISWHAPAGLLGGLFLLSFLFHLFEPDRFPGPLFQLFSGAAMLGAFFIVTDPVTGATSSRGRLLFGLGVAAIAFIIRSFGGYPDGIAFAVLLMNMAAPTIDYYTQPRVYGHGQSR